MDTILAKDAMIRDIYTIHSENRVALARLRMLRHSVGALPVIDKEKKLVGIITLRDIDLAGNEASALLVEDLMTTNLITDNEDAPISEIAETMLRTGIQRIPIVDADHRLIGLVTQTTVIRAAAKWLNQKHGKAS
ncbi:MAG: CBS domain-containing protein [Candidatus Bathyarchaeota archaeon]|nr:CBS domain-containing protein [Candidatus Bathyarchaeota archaeon]